ncbi:MAG: tandem-95 repeat protein, partial [Campylobacteraceae bacterium]|nr:tandem-95 repeat protein [Campylobacteraceae bacterium]
AQVTNSSTGATATDSSTNELSIDLTAPSIAPSVDTLLTNDLTPVITGTASLNAGDTLEVTVNGATYAVSTDANGVWSLDTETATPINGTLGVFVDGTSYDVEVSHKDAAGNEVSDTTTNELTIDTIASEISLLKITDIIDTNGDSSNMIMHGTGAEAGNTIKLYDASNNLIGTGTVSASLTWTIDISIIQSNINKFLKVSETDPANNVTMQVDSTHYIHYNWGSAQTEDSDDYVFGGDGNDILQVNDDDLNDFLVVDGGNDTDKLVFTGNLSDYTITNGPNGYILIEENISTDSDNDGHGDITEARNIELFEFADGTYSASVIALTMSLALDTGKSDTDNYTSNTTMNITGIAPNIEDSGKETLGSGKVSVWEYSLDSGKTWQRGTGTSFELEKDNVYLENEIRVKAIDIFGKEVESRFTAITTDNKVDSASIELDDNTDTGSSSIDKITKTSSPIFKGEAEAGSILELYRTNDSDESTLIKTITVPNNGIWNIDTSNQIEGTYDFHIKVTDLAGNIKLSNVQSVTFDHTSPIDLEITDIINENGDLSSIIMHGKGSEVGNDINLTYEYKGSIYTINGIVLANLTWELDISSIPENLINEPFSKTLTVTETDTAGNISSVSTNYINENFTNTDDYDNSNYVSAQDDYIISGDGNNSTVIFEEDDNGILTVDGGKGIDFLSFYTNSDVRIDLNNENKQDVGMGEITIKNIENVSGDYGKDILIGNDKDNSLYGFKGEDTLIGNAGNDNLFGGDDNDILDGGSGDDILTGGAGNDILRGGSGDDSLSGSFGDDILEGGEGDDYLKADSGNDFLYGGSGNDTLIGASSKTQINELKGGEGDDLINVTRSAGIISVVNSNSYVSDIAVFSGKRDDYNITQHEDGYIIVEDIRDGSPDGTDFVAAGLLKFLTEPDLDKQLISTRVADVLRVELIDDTGLVNDKVTKTTNPQFEIIFFNENSENYEYFGLKIGDVIKVSYDEININIEITQEHIDNNSVFFNIDFDSDLSLDNDTNRDYNINVVIENKAGFTGGPIAIDISLDTRPNEVELVFDSNLLEITVIGLEDDSIFSISRDSGITWTSLEFEQTNPFPVVQIDDYKNIQVRVIDKAGNEYIADTVNVVPIAKDDGVFYLNQVFAGSEVPLLNSGSPSGTKFTMTGSAQTLSILDDDELLEDNTGSNAVEGEQNRDYNAQVLMSSFNGHPEGAYIYSRGYYEVENLTSGKIAKLYQIRIDNDYSGSGVPNTHGQYWAYSDGFVVSSGDEIELLSSFRSGGNVRYVNLDTNTESSLGLTQIITQEDTSITINASTLLANDTDPDGDAFSITSVQDGSNGTVILNSEGTVTFTPSVNYNGIATFTYTITDTNGATDTATVTLKVVEVNDAPIAKDDGVFYLNQVFTGSEVPLLNNGSPLGTKFTMTGSAQTLSILDDDTLLEDNYGSNAVEGEQSSDKNAQVLMSSFNGHPEGAYIYSRGYYEVENLTSGKTARLYQIRIDNDYDGSGIPNTHGQYWAYSDGFVVSSGDEIELLGSLRSGGNVRYVNLDTNAESSLGLTQFITDEDSSIIVDVLENDINLDNDILRIIAVDNPVMLNGVNIGLLEVVSINNKEQIKFTPNDEMDKLEEGEIQNITFSYTLSDGSLSDSASVVIRITGKYDAATVSNIDTSLEEDSSQIVASVSNVDSIIKSNTLSANNGIAVIDENGQITYTPNANFNGSDTITINFLDENNVIKDTKTIEVTIAAVNDGCEGTGIQLSSPLILDLDNEGVETLSLTQGVKFDIDADGDKDLTGWVGADDGLLVRDINNDGIINDASELFGEETIKKDGSKARDGFEALSELDSNNDGLINKYDEAFKELRVWKDSNSDGITQADELLTLEDIDLKEISLNSNIVDYDNNGNIIGLESTYINSKREEKEIADVWFKYEENSSLNVFTNDIDISSLKETI